MGYSTRFTGALKFTNEPTAKQFAKLATILGEDIRDHPEWGYRDLTYIDLRICKDYSGIEWDDEKEKTYDLEDKANVVMQLMRIDFPDFGLKGELVAQGEEMDDRWILTIGDDGIATRHDLPPVGTKVICPHCEAEFRV